LTVSEISTGEDDRLVQLRRWLRAIGVSDDGLTVASADASFRRYFRVPHGGGRIAMDAPPERENCGAFLDVAALLRQAGVRVPQVFASDPEQGFVLLEDLGSETALEAAERGAPTAPMLSEAIAALVRWQMASRPQALPAYDAALLHRELALFPDWYVGRELGRELTAAERRLWERSAALLVEAALAQSRVFVHRDFMLRNLMPTASGLAVIDFQDAVYGPLTYDLVCLLRDAFIEWPAADEEHWFRQYRQAAVDAGLSVPAAEAFRRDIDWMGAQRHLKVIGIFARLCHRDGKCRYRVETPRFFGYLQRELAPWPELHSLRDWLGDLSAG
jgi:aminoglycoside/choline kinase family phosphotransferase